MPTVYRSLAGASPALGDFTSRKALGHSQRLPHETEEKWSGVSVYNNEAQCCKNENKFSFTGSSAEIEVEEDGPITYSKTGSNGHRTLWGEPAEMLKRVVQVIPF